MVGLVRESADDSGLMTAVDVHRLFLGGGCNDIEPSERALAARVFPDGIDEHGVTEGVFATLKEDCPSCSSFSSIIYWSNPTPRATDGMNAVELGRRVEEVVMGATAVAVAPLDGDCGSDAANRRTPLILLVLPPP